MIPDSDQRATGGAPASPTGSRSGRTTGTAAGLRPTAPPTCATNRSGPAPPCSPTHDVIVADSLPELFSTSWKSCFNAAGSATVSRIDATLSSGLVENYATHTMHLAHQHHADHAADGRVGYHPV